nr:hypothetical protein [Caballeronia hypogeia]
MSIEFASVHSVEICVAADHPDSVILAVVSVQARVLRTDWCDLTSVCLKSVRMHSYQPTTQITVQNGEVGHVACFLRRKAGSNHWPVLHELYVYLKKWQEADIVADRLNEANNRPIVVRRLIVVAIVASGHDRSRNKWH